MENIKVRLLSLLFILSSSVYAQNEIKKLDNIKVETQAEQEVRSGAKSIVDTKTIKVVNSAELINPYKVISLEPGVDIRFNDPFGMSVTHKIRGKSNRNIGETLEGLPIKGIGPGGGLSNMIDIENLSSISVQKGAIGADSGFGYGSDNGMVNMMLKKPTKDLEINFKQALGEDSFTKTYLRLDSGEIGNFARLFVSGSYSEADKFKGKGKALERKNFAAGISNASSSVVEWELYGIYNDEKNHAYKGLTYEQSKNIKKNYKIDYDSIMQSGKESNYYDRNKSDFETYSLIAKLKVPLSEQDFVTFRPYYLKDKGFSYFAKGNSEVIDWLVNHETIGGVLEYEHNFQDAKIKIGYWYQEDEPPGPPTSRKIRDAKDLSFTKWERLYEVGKKYQFQTPYISYEQIFNQNIVEVGLKYLIMRSTELISHNTSGIGDVSYDKALSLSKKIDFSLPANTDELFLPYASISHYLNDNSYLKLTYGRNYNTPQYGLGANLINIYAQKGEAIIRKMWKALKPEESDNIDLTYSYEDEKLSFESTLFFSKVKNIAGNMYDPDLNMTYAQNSAKATSYGLEIGTKYNFTDNFSIGGSATYNKYSFDENITTALGTKVKAKGNQRPDTPLFFGNLLATYNLYGYEISPIVRYLGKRYVDVEKRYSIKESVVVDLSINKEFKWEGHKFDFSLACTNLLNKKYISSFEASEFNTSRDITYKVGAPRTLFGSISYKF